MVDSGVRIYNIYIYTNPKQSKLRVDFLRMIEGITPTTFLFNLREIVTANINKFVRQPYIFASLIVSIAVYT